MCNLAIAASLLLLAGPATAQNSRESAQLLKVLPPWKGDNNYEIFDIVLPLSDAIKFAWGSEDERRFLDKVLSEIMNPNKSTLRMRIEKLVDLSLCEYKQKSKISKFPEAVKERTRALKYAEMRISLIRLGYYY